MKKIILSIFLISAVNNVFCQDLLETITKEVCSCSKAKLDANAKPKDIEMDLGLCIMSSYAAHKEAVVDKYGDVVKNENKMEKLGSKIGEKMLSVCPDVLLQIGLASDEKDVVESKVSEIKSLEGEIVEIKTDQLVTVIVKDKNGRNQSFLFLNYFDTASLITNNEVKKGSKITVSYEEKELYDSTSKDFRYYKIITKLEK